jgi:hypothetical protein
MLAGLRKHSRSVIIYVLFGIIIVVFVFTFNMGSTDVGCGGGQGTQVSDTALAQVGKTVVDGSMMAMGLALTAEAPSPSTGMDPKAFQAEMVYRSTRFARLRGDPKYAPYIPDPRMVSELKVRKVADDLAETLLVSDEAEKQGLRASPDEIRSRIVGDFTDPSNGQFRKKTYENYVRYGLRTSLGRFEEFVGREILREKMIDLVTAGVAVSDREARYVASQRKASRTYDYLEVDPQILAEALKPTPAQAASWLAANEELAKKFFEEHQAEYQRDEAFDYHVIRVSAPSRRMMASFDDPEQLASLKAARDDAKARANDVAAALKDKTGDALVAAFIDSVAKASDDQLTKERGGRVEAPLPAQAVASLTDPAVAAALARLQPRTASGVIEGDQGFFLVLLQGIQPKQERSFEDVKVEVAATMIARDSAKTRAAMVANDVLARLQADATKSLADIAAEANAAFGPATPVQVGETGAVPTMPASLSGLADYTPGALPGLGESPELAKAAEALTAERSVASQVFTLPGADRLVVLRLKGSTAAGEPTADEIAAAKGEFLPLKKQGYWREWYNAMKTKAAADGRFVEKEPLQAMVRDEARAREEALIQELTGGKGLKTKPPVPANDGE